MDGDYMRYYAVRNGNKTGIFTDWEECKKYAPVAGIKEMGYFDTGMGQSSVDWINSDYFWIDYWKYYVSFNFDVLFR